MVWPRGIPRTPGSNVAEVSVVDDATARNEAELSPESWVQNMSYRTVLVGSIGVPSV
jgi:hypothetical protein